MSSFGRYRLLERLGSGGMAEVFKAKSFGVEGFEKVVVIKRILPELAKSAEFVDMFIHEAKLAVRLSHANIVQVFDLGIAPGETLDPAVAEGAEPPPDAYYMAMEYVHGFDLATLLARVRRAQLTLPIDICVYIASEVAKGLDHAHRRRDESFRPLNIVHLDVSPQNVLLSTEGEVKVTDFGIAKARGVLENTAFTDTSSRKIHGKFGYMSPEQARGDVVDVRSDLFSLGVVLYECVAGVNPFSAPTTFETLRRVQACEYPPIELLRPDAPSDFVQILRTAMAKEPADRYADAGRMYEAMLAFLYAHGHRSGAHELAELLGRFRESADTNAPPAMPDLDRDGLAGANERTPVEAPAGRSSSSSASRLEIGVRHVPVDRATELGERREVTALVIELAARDTDAPAEAAAAIVRRYGGRIVKRDPEQIAAIFGIGDPDGRDTEIATRCALVALRTLDGPRRPSAGIHAARIHVSSGGEPTQDERWSGLIATARDLARLREGRCAVSTAAMRPIRSLFVAESPADADASGPVPITHAVLIKEVRGLPETFGRFVGRKDELRRIGEVLAAATKRQARVLTLRGDHGVGKTRLLYEVERRLRKGSYNIGWHICTCPPRGRELPLSGIAAMLQALCGIAEGDNEERVLAVQPRLRALGLHDEEVAAVLGLLGAQVTPPPPRNAGSGKLALRNAFTRMVISLCEDRPHMLSWDAAHAMDPDSFALLEAVFQRLQSARVLFAFAARDGFVHPLEKLVAHAGIELGDLDDESRARLVSARLGVEQAPDELLRFVHERAGGHPLFIEEIVKGLLETRSVTVADKKVVSMRLVGQEIVLPKTLRGLVASRVARIEAHDRATLQAAAVLGDPMNVTVLAQMLGEEIGALESSLAVLKDHAFLVHTGPSELRFTSPVVREVVADALTHEALREMHAAAGHAMRTVLGDKAWEQAAEIATHLYEAGDRENAASYFAKSAERRLESRQLEAAAREYAKAIDLCDVARRSPKELAAWLGGLATAVRLVRSSPEALETCERIVARVDEEEDDGARVRVRVDAGRILGALHRFDAARARFDEAETIAGEDEAQVKLVLVAKTELAARQGDFRRSLEVLERLEKIVSVEGDRVEEHKLLVSLSQARAAVGDRRGALQYLERAEQLLPNDATAACEREKLRCLVEFFARDYRAAAAASERAIDGSRALGLTYEVAVNLHNLGDILIRQDDYPRAYGALQQSLALCDESGFERLGSHNRMFLAYLDAVAGDAEAANRLQQGIRYAAANDFTWEVLGGRALYAQLLLRQGEGARAQVELEKLRTAANEAGNQLIVSDCDLALQAMAS